MGSALKLSIIELQKHWGQETLGSAQETLGSALKLSIIELRGFRFSFYLSADRLVDRGQFFPQLAFARGSGSESLQLPDHFLAVCLDAVSQAGEEALAVAVVTADGAVPIPSGLPRTVTW